MHVYMCATVVTTEEMAESFCSPLSPLSEEDDC